MVLLISVCSFYSSSLPIFCSVWFWVLRALPMLAKEPCLQVSCVPSLHLPFMEVRLIEHPGKKDKSVIPVTSRLAVLLP